MTETDVLPTRRRGTSLAAGLAVVLPPNGTEKHAMTEALQQIGDRIDAVVINGVLVATRDGVVLCALTRDVENESVAAMAAAAAGLAAQFSARAKIDSPRGVFVEGDTGQVGVFPVDTSTVLVVLSARNTTMGMFNVAAKQVLSLLQQEITAHR